MAARSSTQKQAMWKNMAKRRDISRCHYCGVGISRRLPQGDPKAATLDHVVPLAKGGEWKLYNLVPACRACNMKKADA